MQLADAVMPATFLSTPSARRATQNDPKSGKLCGNFYPRPPRGGRLNGSGSIDVGGIFLSTPSARRATTTSEPWAA